MGLFGKKDKEQKPPAVSSAAAPAPVAKSHKRETTLDTTYFGKNLQIKGNVSGEGSLIILGSFEGEFDLKGRLQVAQGARIKGDIKATDIYVNGEIEGAVTASEKVHLDTTARIKGGIATPRLSVLEGAQFDGELKMRNQAARTSQPPSIGDQKGDSKQASPSSVTPDKKVTELK